MENIKTISGVSIDKDEKGNFVVTNWNNTINNLSPFINEVRHMGGVLNQAADTLTIKDVTIKRLVGCVSAYYAACKNMSPSQKRWKEKLIDEIFDNQDMIIKKDNLGIFLIDPHQISGTINEIKQDLEKENIVVVKVVNRKRVYMEFPTMETTPSSKKKTKSRNKKKKIAINNKNLIAGDVVKYVGKGFDGFSKFNPKAKFVSYGDGDTVVIEYKKLNVTVGKREITKI
jgi:hypothetical protein